MRLFKILLMLICVLAMQQVAAVETGSALKTEAIKKEPYSDAKTTGTLTLGDKVNIFRKEGGWLNVKSAKGNGWVRMLSIRRGDAKKEKSLADSIKGLASGRSGTGKVVATTGIRGLNDEELKSAKFDADELNLAESYLTSRAEAQSFADQGKLKARGRDYLPLPQ
jgi:hypothetical protein